MFIRIIAVLAALSGALSAPAADLSAEHVLVFGGTGRTGVEIVRELHEAGATITLFVRPTSNRQPLEPYDANFVVGDALIAADVERAVDGADYTSVISAIGKRRPLRSDKPPSSSNVGINPPTYAAKAIVTAVAPTSLCAA